MSYIPVQTEAAGDALARALWDAHRPASDRQPGEITSRLAAPVQDVSGSWWLEIDDAYEEIALAQLTEAQIDSIVDEIERVEDLL